MLCDIMHDSTSRRRNRNRAVASNEFHDSHFLFVHRNRNQQSQTRKGVLGRTSTKGKPKEERIRLHPSLVLESNTWSSIRECTASQAHCQIPGRCQATTDERPPRSTPTDECALTPVTRKPASSPRTTRHDKENPQQQRRTSE
jgi:hypothetical protein